MEPERCKFQSLENKSAKKQCQCEWSMTGGSDHDKFYYGHVYYMYINSTNKVGTRDDKNAQSSEFKIDTNLIGTTGASKTLAFNGYCENGSLCGDPASTNLPKRFWLILKWSKSAKWNIICLNMLQIGEKCHSAALNIVVFAFPRKIPGQFGEYDTKVPPGLGRKSGC